MGRGVSLKDVGRRTEEWGDRKMGDPVIGTPIPPLLCRFFLAIGRRAILQSRYAYFSFHPVPTRGCADCGPVYDVCESNGCNGAVTHRNWPGYPDQRAGERSARDTKNF